MGFQYLMFLSVTSACPDYQYYSQSQCSSVPYGVYGAASEACQKHKDDSKYEEHKENWTTIPPSEPPNLEIVLTH